MNPATHEPAARRSGDEPAWLYVLGWDLTHVGGVNQVVSNMFDRTERLLGHRPILFVNTWDHKTPLTSVRDGRFTVHARIRSPWNPERRVTNLLIYALGLPWVLRRLLAFVRRERIATIHIHFPDLHVLTWLLVRRLAGGDTRLFVSFHGLDLKPALASRGLPRLGWSVLLRAADRVLVCSEQLRRQLVAVYPHLQSGVHVIDNGVDVKSLESECQTPPSVTLPSVFIASIGTYEPKKAHDVLMKAFDRAAPKVPPVALVIVGRQGAEEYARLHGLKERLACRDRILLLKELAHPEAMRLLARAQAFVLASRDEPFGIVLLEAAVLGKPMIATDACGAALLFSADTELLRVPADDVDALAEALVRLLNDQEYASSLARRARARVVAEFDWDRVMNRYADLLEPPSSRSVAHDTQARRRPDPGSSQ